MRRTRGTVLAVAVRRLAPSPAARACERVCAAGGSANAGELRAPATSLFGGMPSASGCYFSWCKSSPSPYLARQMSRVEMRTPGVTDVQLPNLFGK